LRGITEFKNVKTLKGTTKIKFLLLNAILITMSGFVLTSKRVEYQLVSKFTSNWTPLVLYAELIKKSSDCTLHVVHEF